MINDCILCPSAGFRNAGFCMLRLLSFLSLRKFCVLTGVLVLRSVFFFSATMELGTGKTEEIIMYSCCPSCLICFGFLSCSLSRDRVCLDTSVIARAYICLRHSVQNT